MKTPDVMLKLVAGVGSEEEGACWMSAISYYSGEVWGDHPSCVCPVIRNLAVGLNDECTDIEREKLIGPHLFAPVGTEQGAVIKLLRSDLLVPFAMEMALYAANASNAATDTAANASANAATDTAAYAAAYAANAAANAAAYSAAYSANSSAKAAAYAANAADAATDAATDATDLLDPTARDEVLTRWRDFILELCEIGKETRGGVEQVRDVRDLPRSCLV